MRNAYSCAQMLILVVAGTLLPYLEAHAEDLRRYCYTVPTVESDQTTYFERAQRRCDLVWMADKVTIDQPLMSNGGDVVIFADQVEINAPIDTRPYFETKQVFYDPSGSSTWVEPWSWYRGDLIPSYGALFYWREIYDPVNKVLDFAESKGHWDDYQDAWLRASYSAPQLPAARSPMFGVGRKIWGIKNGQNAPRPSSEARVSGSILIVADRITFCDKCREPYTPVPLGPGSNGAADDGDVRRRKFLIASGVKGGLGSPGTQMGCHKYSLCGAEDWDNIGGMNTDGGDAGDVRVIDLGASDDTTGLLERLSEADAGMPPFAARLRARSINAMNASKSRDRRSFERVPIEFPRTAKAGEIRIDRGVSLEVGLAALQDRLSSWNFARKYDAKLLVEQIRLYPGAQEVVLPIDMLDRRLLEIRRNQYLAMLARMPNLAERGAQDVLQISLPLVSDLSCARALRLSLSEAVAYEVVALCNRDRIPFSLLDNDPAAVLETSYAGAALRARVQSVGDAINRLAFDIKEGVQLLDDANVRADTQALEARAAALVEQIQKLQDDAARQSGDPFAAALSAFASEALPGLAEGINLLRAARAQSDPTKADGNYKKASDKFVGVLGLFAKQIGGMLIRADTDTGGQQQVLVAQLAEVLRNIAQLQADAQSRREARMDVLSASAKSLMSERRAVLQDYRSALDSFEPLLRYAMLRAATQTHSTNQFLDQRVMDLRSYLKFMGASALPSTFFGAFLPCAASEIQVLSVTQPGMRSASDCVRVINRTNETLSIDARHPVLGTVSLFVLEPGRQKEVSLRNYNFQRDSTGRTQLRIQGKEELSSLPFNEWDITPKALKSLCGDVSPCPELSSPRD